MFSQDDRQSFCNICLNKGKDGEFTICGLTDNFADFDYSCKDFNLDKIERAKIENELEINYKRVNEREVEPPFELNNALSNWKFTNTVQFTDFDSQGIEVPLKLSPKKNAFILPIVVYVGALTLLFFLNPNFIRSTFEKNPNFLTTSGIAAMLLAPLILIYKLFDKRAVLTLTKDGLNTKHEDIPWHRIVSTYVLEGDLNGMKKHTLVIHRHEEYDPITEDLDFLPIGPYKIAYFIEVLKKKYKKN